MFLLTGALTPPINFLGSGGGGIVFLTSITYLISLFDYFTYLISLFYYLNYLNYLI